MSRRRNVPKKPIESYSHTGEERANNPPVGLVSAESDPDLPEKYYKHLGKRPPPAK